MRMAIYHCSIKIIGRSNGKSAVSSSAYRSGKKLVDKETGIIHDYTRKSGVIYQEVSLCKNAPKAYQNRETLWNAVHQVEKKSNAQLAREIEVALPIEFHEELQKEVLRKYVQQFVDEGMCADWAIHDKGNGNPHAHIMLTTRSIQKDGTWNDKQKTTYKLDENREKVPVIDPATGQQKIGARGRKMWQRETIPTNDWNDQGKAEQWREAWAVICNAYLSEEQKIDHRSYARQGVWREPTIHEGYTARKMEKSGKVSERCQENREIQVRNLLLTPIQQELEHISHSLKQCEWEEKAQKAVKKPQMAFCHQYEIIPRKAENRSYKPSEGFIEREKQKNKLQEELDRLNAEYQAACWQVDQLLQAKKQWHAEPQAYLCNTEAGRKAKLYYENAESEIWQSYERALFKHRFKSRSEYYKIHYVLEMKKWFKRKNIEIPDKKELELSEECIDLEEKQWDKKVKDAILQRDSLDWKIYGLKNKIQLLEEEETLPMRQKPKQTSKEKPPINRKKQDWGFDR